MPEKPQCSIIVKFRDREVLPYVDGLESLIQAQLGFGAAFVGEIQGCTFNRVYRTIPPDWVRGRIDSACKKDPAYKPCKLLNYFVLECPNPQVRDTLLKRLTAFDTIERAYGAPVASDPQVNSGPNPYWVNQYHLRAPPWGINAQFAWTVAGGDGTGQEVIDLEQGWTLDHVELAYLGIAAPLYGEIVDSSRPHGTAVLGVICAEDNNAFGVGITPKLAPGSVNVVSYSGVTSSLPEAIMFAASRLGTGGVLVLEVQVQQDGLGPLLPCETDPLIFEQIRLATAHGIVVVEAAGNGNSDLDAFPTLDRGNLAFADSGAILVGSANLGAGAVPGWPRRPNSNYGSRVDCFAQGERIYTASSEVNPAAVGARIADTATFDSTSGATAIIAGAALSVQGMAQALTGARLAPSALRDLLTRSGTPSGSLANEPIGIMPDLEAIANALS